MRRRANGRATLAALLALSPGCALPRPAMAPVSRDFEFSTGQGAQTFPAPSSAVAVAVAEALSDLDMRDVRPLRDGAVLRYEAVTKDDRSCSATIRSLAGSSTATVRVGWFGDEALSRAILDRVAVRLGERPPEPIPDEPPSTPARNPFFSRDAVPDSVMLRDQVEAPYNDRVVP
ncbi:MAG: hypothetical protein BGO49_23305 [Planctomycetales bacterium 71-10]|nr:MAG: hypothetical protein BGO49_23305 [Planctomycetales bacterium 71-10]